MEITARELGRLIELNKKRAELEFKKTVLNQECESELRAIISNAAEIASKAKAAGIEIVIPNEIQFTEMGKTLEKFSPEQIRDSLKIKNGLPYETLWQRGIIVKRNHENRSEIAKLAIAIAKMHADEREGLSSAIRLGEIDGKIELKSVDENTRNTIVKFLRRCGIGCEVSGNDIVKSETSENKEVRMELQSKPVWVNLVVMRQLETNLKRLNQVNAIIQLKNAERQIKLFTEDEEKNFVTLQREYLELLKEQDELLKEFNEEENSSIKLS